MANGAYNPLRMWAYLLGSLLLCIAAIVVAAVRPGMLAVQVMVGLLIAQYVLAAGAVMEWEWRSIKDLRWLTVRYIFPYLAVLFVGGVIVSGRLDNINLIMGVLVLWIFMLMGRLTFFLPKED